MKKYTGPLTGELKPIVIDPDGTLVYEDVVLDLRSREGQAAALELYARPFGRTPEMARDLLARDLARLAPPQVLLVP